MIVAATPRSSRVWLSCACRLRGVHEQGGQTAEVDRVIGALRLLAIGKDHDVVSYLPLSESRTRYRSLIPSAAQRPGQNVWGPEASNHLHE